MQEPTEYARWLDRRRLELAHRAHDRNNKFIDDMWVAAINSCGLVLRNAALINGAAVVALLHMTEKGDGFQNKPALANSLSWFAFGVLFASLGLTLAYATNYCAGRARVEVQYDYDDTHEEHPFIKPKPQQKLWARLNAVSGWGAFVLCMVSLAVCFLEGVLIVRNGMAS